MAKDTTMEYASQSHPYSPLLVPSDRLENTTPVIHKPAAVLSNLNGTQITGTIITVDDPTTGVALLNIATGAIYYHILRNVATYSGSAEDTFVIPNFGDEVYYDRSAVMPALVELSLSPLDQSGAANPVFGHIVWTQTETPEPFQGDRDPYPLGTAVATTHSDIGIMQRGIS